MTNKKGQVIVITGPSGVGKGTILKNVMEADKSLCFSVSATTRAARPGEVDGVDYYFVTRERFDEMVKDGELLEYAEYSGNCYGTPRKPLEKLLNEGYDVILDIEIQGARNVMKTFPEAIFTFIMPPSFETLEKRLIKRGTETPEKMALRLETAKRELECFKEFQYIIVNDKLEDAVEDFKAVIRAGRCRCSEYIKNKRGI